MWERRRGAESRSSVRIFGQRPDLAPGGFAVLPDDVQTDTIATGSDLRAG